MKIDVGNKFDSFLDGTKEVAETAHEKTKELHENYVSKAIPDMGKYGDAAKFAAEMAPGVSEYNALVDGDWQAFAIAAGIDIAAVGVGAVTAGAGYGAVKGGSVAAKTGAKIATKKAVKEVAEAGTKKILKETAETGAEKVVKEAVEAGAEKIVKETAETGAEKMMKESIHTSFKEATENAAEKAMKLDDVEKKAVQIVKNKMDGIAREERVLKKLSREFGKDNVIPETYIRNSNGEIIKDMVTGEARRIDFIVKQGDKVVKSIEVTSKSADKALQMAKETRILKQAKELGGAFIKDPATGKLISFGENIVTTIERLN